ncbi:sensor histidine kinase [Bacillus horti]|uniref:histidine kinase n=1 Tax=Caldalkalibacillus horti TaxID=77523 RepID=A0ABT9VTH9_9BACI|nr:ATP-binding protein [Bacillus horti]MDQ0164195.1 signal transduction histidine kinase [Bacillus horti]
MIFGIGKSLFRRLILSFMVTVLIGLGIVGIIISYLVKGYIFESTQEEMLRKAKIVNLSIQDMSINAAETEQFLLFLDQSFNSRIWVFDRDGKIISTSTRDEVTIGKSVATSIVGRVLRGENVVSRLSFEGLNEPMLSVVVPWGKEDVVYGGIVLHSPVVGINKTVMKIRETVILTSVFGIILSTAMVSFLSWSISRPLREIDRTASKISVGNYSERINIDSEDEIGDLANTINTMAEKLEKIDYERNKLDQMRNDFLANVSHELRTPLTAMQGFLEALQDGLVEKEESRKKYYDVMYKETLHMSRLVEDIFDLIKLEHNEISLDRSPVHIGSILNKVAFKFKQQADEKGLEINVRADDTLESVYADRDRLEQIVANLVKNALKFTEHGGVTLEAYSDNDKMKLVISDTGIGVSKDDQELIWERFFKVDRGRSKENKGTGLGLAIVKELVDMHQGTIKMESQLGEGTTFTLWLPLFTPKDKNTSTIKSRS